LSRPADCCHHRGPWKLHGQGACINIYILCAVGAAVGWLGGIFMRTDGRVVRIEEMLVGVFGAFAGGDFLLSVLSEGVYVPPFFSMASLGMAIAGAAVMLVLLRVMRGAVGPLKHSKSRARR
jgi:uncharacterized membrane protein YeaQ/YmgE (transglycosylase-associated protein family)